MGKTFKDSPEHRKPREYKKISRRNNKIPMTSRLREEHKNEKQNFGFNYGKNYEN